MHSSRALVILLVSCSFLGLGQTVRATEPSPSGDGADSSATATPKGGADAVAPKAKKNDDDVTVRARSLFKAGSKAFLGSRYAEALESLEESYGLYPSPNTLLLIGRCMAHLGRPLDAYKTLQKTDREAQRRMEAGEEKYRATQESAAEEALAERQKLMVVAVRVRGVKGQLTIVAGEERKVLDADGAVELLHVPGTVEVLFQPTVGSPLARRVSGKAGQQVDLAVDLAEEADSGPAHSSLVLPAAIAGGIGAVGFAMFVGFGVRSESIYDGLAERCAPNCGPADRDEADEGERFGVAANVGLALGIAGAATGLALGATILFGSSESASADNEVSVSVSPQGVWLRLGF